ncbi:MAG: hypothetical protein Q8L59_11185 [Phenylobacterium sp.]|uniref:hypothetical protein n=1 Tax=Phenylobacterium sp. TaxID=1871053 RepID=UPI00273323C4|nr:hypothetical protein [Phenylobacterium sp.]MDP1642738.1 hypothetical protein [Phenylobacterium sp.]MDP3117214.1 hypothetical protein [Phenylobacterium sp.]
MSRAACTCNWPGCAAGAIRSSWACADHWPRLDAKVRIPLAHAAPRPGEEPRAYFLRAGAEASAWIERHLAKSAGGGEGLV